MYKFWFCENTQNGTTIFFVFQYTRILKWVAFLCSKLKRCKTLSKVSEQNRVRVLASVVKLSF